MFRFMDDIMLQKVIELYRARPSNARDVSIEYVVKYGNFCMRYIADLPGMGDNVKVTRKEEP